MAGARKEESQKNRDRERPRCKGDERENSERWRRGKKEKAKEERETHFSPIFRFPRRGYRERERLCRKRPEEEWVRRRENAGERQRHHRI